MIEGIKVVTAQEMARIEKGETGHEKFMEEAGRKVAWVAMEWIEKQGLPKRVTLLVGTGNNGGDAYAAGACLLEEHFHVEAIPIEGTCSPLNQKFRELFFKKGGKVGQKLQGLLLDGLLGTGFRGKVEGEIAKWIERANASELPILAIDIPSGLNGTTGEASPIAIQASATIALGLPKIGFFLRDGWNHLGQLRIADFGLSAEALASAEAIAYLPLQLKLPKIVRNRHKYEAGFCVGFGGSKIYSGAPKLAGLAALKSGAGIVKLFHPEEIGPVPLELISIPWRKKIWEEALQKAGAAFLGPGLGRSKKTENWLKKELKRVQVPCVIDAEALLPSLAFPAHSILTPHRGEACRLLGIKGAKEEALLAQVTRFSEKRNVTVVLKGAPTFVFSPHSKPVIIPFGDPGMATAGSGDVLTGILCSLLAQKCSLQEAAVLGTVLHGLAGQIAAQHRTSYCMTAQDLIEFMPAAVQSVLRGAFYNRC